jgi:hypothetical protein
MCKLGADLETDRLLCFGERGDLSQNETEAAIQTHGLAAQLEGCGESESLCGIATQKQFSRARGTLESFSTLRILPLADAPHHVNPHYYAFLPRSLVRVFTYRYGVRICAD